MLEARALICLLRGEVLGYPALVTISVSSTPTPIWAYLGFDQRNVDYTIEVIDPLSGNATLELAVGRYDPSRIARILAGCDECAQPETIEYAGVSYYAWQDGFSAI